MFLRLALISAVLAVPVASLAQAVDTIEAVPTPTPTSGHHMRFLGHGHAKSEVQTQAANGSSHALHLYRSSSAAQAHCPQDTVVWVNTRSGAIHPKSDTFYGKTKHGAFSCRREAIKAYKKPNPEPTPSNDDEM